jgi:hypothetical protein
VQINQHRCPMRSATRFFNHLQLSTDFRFDLKSVKGKENLPKTA